MSEVDNKSINQTAVVDSELNDKLKNFNSAGDSLGNNASVETTSPTLTSPQMDKKTPVKRTPSKRMSFIERAQKESEELVKNMGGSLELEGGRRTRSSTRGTPTRAASLVSPPPNKKSRSSPAKPNSTSTRARGRGRKLNTSAELEVPEANQEQNPNSENKSAVEENNVGEESTKQSHDAVDAVVDADSPKEEHSVNDENLSEKNKKEEKVEKVPVESVAEKAAEDKVDQGQSEPSVDNGLEASAEKADNAPSQGSPMDTDEPIENVPIIVQSENENAVKPAKETSISGKSDEHVIAPEVPAEKQPTPEPMDVDANSKSNDEVDTTAVAASEPVVLEKAENLSDDKKIEENSIESAASAEQVVESKPKDAVESEHPILETSVTNDVIEESKSNEETTVTNNNNAENNAVENDVAPIVEETINSVDKKIINDVELKSGTNIETLSNENKMEKDLCAPKIVPETIATTADNALTMPQSCN